MLTKLLKIPRSFSALQRAWDNNDLSKIQEYVTPELYNLLREERANQPANNRTEIVRLFVELGDVLVAVDGETVAEGATMKDVLAVLDVPNRRVDRGS